MQTSYPLWYNRDMATPPSPRRVTYTHPDLPRLTMTGTVAHDEWEGEELFYPDDEFHEQLFELYGYDAEAGLFLGGATVSPSP